eukprot:2356783-Pleurochrysis_carterae.AAC.1
MRMIMMMMMSTSSSHHPDGGDRPNAKFLLPIPRSPSLSPLTHPSAHLSTVTAFDDSVAKTDGATLET